MSVLRETLVSYFRIKPCAHVTVFKRSMSHFNIISHTARCQHTRHWQGAVEPGHEHSLGLAVKQYVPKSNPKPRPGDVTFIGAAANGFPKEMYEPLWDELYQRMTEAGKSIRGIWIADVAHQGESGVLNEKKLGNDPSWYDHARDLLFLINQYQDEMPAPLIGIGNSVGAMHLTHLSLIHPSLLYSLILIDPTIQIPNPGKDFAPASTYRRDLWPSRKVAAESFAKSKFYQAWDPKVLDLWVKHGLRDTPTELYPDVPVSREKPVTLTTTKAQEVWTYLRPAYNIHSTSDQLSFEGMRPDDILEPLYPFYRPEPAQIFRQLPDIKPSTLYVFGTKSPISTAEARKAKVETTGNKTVGSNRKTEEVIVEGGGHLIAFEQVEVVGKAIAQFVDVELEKWEGEQDLFKRRWHERGRKERAEIDAAWKQYIGPPPGRGVVDSKEKL